MTQRAAAMLAVCSRVYDEVAIRTGMDENDEKRSMRGIN
jgi:hypothetical protein